MNKSNCAEQMVWTTFALLVVSNIFQITYAIYLVLAIMVAVAISSCIIRKTGSHIWVFIVLALMGIVASLLKGTTDFYILARGVSYVIPFMLAIYFGAYNAYVGVSEKRFVQIITYAGIVYSVYYLVRTVVNFTGNYSSLRDSRATSYLIPVAFAIIIVYKLNREELFEKKSENLFFLILIISVLLNLSRTSLLIIGVTTAIGILAIARKRNYFGRALLVIIILIVGFVGVEVYVAYNTESIIASYINLLDLGVDQFLGKVQISSSADIIHNWRNYENQMAVIQFKNADLLEKIFGQGYQGVYVGQYSTLVMEADNSGYLPVLHNAYYTILTYSGVFGLIIFIITQISLVKHVTYDLRTKNNAFPLLTLCLMISIYLSATIIRSFIGKYVLMEVGLIIGFYFYRRRQRQGINSNNRSSQ